MSTSRNTLPFPTPFLECILYIVPTIIAILFATLAIIQIHALNTMVTRAGLVVDVLFPPTSCHGDDCSSQLPRLAVAMVIQATIQLLPVALGPAIVIFPRWIRFPPRYIPGVVLVPGGAFTAVVQGSNADIVKDFKVIFEVLAGADSFPYYTVLRHGAIAQAVLAPVIGLGCVAIEFLLKGERSRREIQREADERQQPVEAIAL